VVDPNRPDRKRERAEIKRGGLGLGSGHVPVEREGWSRGATLVLYHKLAIVLEGGKSQRCNKSRKSPVREPRSGRKADGSIFTGTVTGREGRRKARGLRCCPSLCRGTGNCLTKRKPGFKRQGKKERPQSREGRGINSRDRRAAHDFAQ